MNILAIETSFDETACAVVKDGTKIISNVLASSHEMHDKYGGVVPEIAARRQLECMIPIISETLEVLLPKRTSESPSDQASVINETIKRHIDAIAVTVGPGLIGSLLVGVETARTLAFVCQKPIIPVNHVIAHMFANFVNLQPTTYNLQPVQFPAISLVVSGGHTELYLMKSAKDLMWLGGTLDDAAGECFDKTARLLGMGHGGGVAIEVAASKYRIANSRYQIKLPRPMIGDKTFNFSFSGLKTAVMREWKKTASSSSLITHPPSLVSAFAYEIQESITDVLVEKTIRAAKRYGAISILLSGGVAANTRLREKFNSSLITHSPRCACEAGHSSLNFLAPPKNLCTDNAVMIGAAAFFNGEPADWHSITAQPDLRVEA